MPRAVGWTLTLAVVLSLSCREDEVQEVALDSGGTDAIEYGECEPGEELPCICANGFSGTQLCLASGYERAACMCGGTPLPPADSGGPPPTTTASSSGTGGSGTSAGSSSGSSGTGLDTSGG